MHPSYTASSKAIAKKSGLEMTNLRIEEDEESDLVRFSPGQQVVKEQGERWKDFIIPQTGIKKTS